VQEIPPTLQWPQRALIEHKQPQQAAFSFMYRCPLIALQADFLSQPAWKVFCSWLSKVNAFIYGLLSKRPTYMVFHAG
jgi:hypothetical protein